MKKRNRNLYSKMGLYLLMLMMIFTTACGQSNAKTDVKSNTATTSTPDIKLQAAILAGNLGVVKQHIDVGSNLDKKDQMSGATPLISAITFGHTDIAKALIDGGANLAAKNNEGSTALHVAAFFCKIEIVQMLIDAGADKTIRNNYGSTARQSVTAPFAQIKPVYDMILLQLEPIGLKLDMAEVEKKRSVVAMMLQ